MQNKTKNLLIFMALTCFSVSQSLAQDVWVQKANFTPGNRAGAYAFAIGDKGYIGSGVNNNGTATVPSDLWEYDPATDQWTQKATFTANTRYGATGFSIGQKGYVCMGSTLSGAYNNNLWEYDPTTNTWVQKASFPGAARYTCASFVIGNYAYVGMGKSGGYYSDFYRYDPSTDSWSAIANIPGSLRQNAKGFSIGEKGYVVGGATDVSNYNYLYQYSPANNTWTLKAPYPGNGRFAFSCFIKNNLAYVGTGSLSNTPAPNTFSDIYSYNTAEDSWTFATTFQGGVRNSTVSLNIGTRCFMGLGSAGVYPVIAYQSDWWEFTDTCTFDAKINIESDLSCYGSCDGDLKVVKKWGAGPLSYLWSNGSTTKEISNLCAGYYTVTITGPTGCSKVKRKQLCEVPRIIAANTKTEITAPGADDGTITWSTYGGTPPYTYLWSDGYTTGDRTNIANGQYDITITDSKGCIKVVHKWWKNPDAPRFGSLKNNYFDVYPNPFKDILTLNIDASVSPDCSIKISDVQGKVVLTKDYILSDEDQQIKIDMSGFEKGIYILNISNNGIMENRKIILE